MLCICLCLIDIISGMYPLPRLLFAPLSLAALTFLDTCLFSFCSIQTACPRAGPPNTVEQMDQEMKERLETGWRQPAFSHSVSNSVLCPSGQGLPSCSRCSGWDLGPRVILEGARGRPSPVPGWARHVPAPAPRPPGPWPSSSSRGSRGDRVVCSMMLVALGQRCAPPAGPGGDALFQVQTGGWTWRRKSPAQPSPRHSSGLEPGLWPGLRGCESGYECGELRGFRAWSQCFAEPGLGAGGGQEIFILSPGSFLTPRLHLTPRPHIS